MAFGGRRRRDRNRQLRGALLTGAKWLFVLGVLLGLGYSAHQAGSKLARVEVERLQKRVGDLERERSLLETQTAQLRGELDGLNRRLRELQGRYDAEVPRGALAEIVTLTREKLAAGIGGERLLQVVRNAERVTRCTGPVVSRRFRIGIGDTATEEDSTSFADGLIRVSAVVPATAEDIARATSVTFSGLGSGGTRTVTGLPAVHTFVIENQQLRLGVALSQVRGFAAASLTTCRIE